MGKNKIREKKIIALPIPSLLMPFMAAMYEFGLVFDAVSGDFDELNKDFHCMFNKKTTDFSERAEGLLCWNKWLFILDKQ